MHRLASSEFAKHQAKCNACKMFPVNFILNKELFFLKIFKLFYDFINFTKDSLILLFFMWVYSIVDLQPAFNIYFSHF